VGNEPQHRQKHRIQRIATLLDDCFEIPFLKIKFGWDALLGLIPGFGDLAGVLLGLLLVREALALQVPFSVLARMVILIGVDFVAGALPFIGDIADVFVRSNRWNADLLLKYIDSAPTVVRRSRWFVAGVTLMILSFVIAVVGLTGYGVWALVLWIFPPLTI
jgi:hypothetical protein